jgi:hypothetical protein
MAKARETAEVVNCENGSRLDGANALARGGAPGALRRHARNSSHDEQNESSDYDGVILASTPSKL